MDRSAYRSMRDAQDEHWWFVGRRRILRRLIERHLPRTSENRILEAGCGYGGNLGLLGEFGAISAFEYDEDARAYSAERYGLDIKHGMLPDAVDLEGQTFDLIVMFDVLEHIEADNASLSTLAKHLTPGGRIMVTVPAFQWLWSKHDEIHHHKRRYSRRSLRDCFEAAGLEARHAGYFNTILFPLAVIERLIARFVPARAGSAEMPGSVLNRVLGTIFASEARWIGRGSFPFGLSLYAIAERPAGS